MTTSRCWLGISAPAWLKESDTPQGIAAPCQPRPVALHLRTQQSGLPPRSSHPTRLPHRGHGVPMNEASQPATMPIQRAERHAETPAHSGVIEQLLAPPGIVAVSA